MAVRLRREGAHGRVVVLHRLDVALARDRDPVLRALELRLQIAEVLVDLQLADSSPPSPAVATTRWTARPAPAGTGETLRDRRAAPASSGSSPRAPGLGHRREHARSCAATPLTVLTRFGIRSARRWYWLTTSDQAALGRLVLRPAACCSRSPTAAALPTTSRETSVRTCCSSSDSRAAGNLPDLARAARRAGTACRRASRRTPRWNCGMLRHHAVGAVFARAVRIGEQAHAQLLVAVLARARPAPSRGRSAGRR